MRDEDVLVSELISDSMVIRLMRNWQFREYLEANGYDTSRMGLRGRDDVEARDLDRTQVTESPNGETEKDVKV